MKRLLTGDRTTGNLHLGHYVGSLAERVKLQDQYESALILADWHVLTTKPQKEAIEKSAQAAYQIALDYLSCGIDPEKVIIYLQSAVSATAELHLFFTMLTTQARVARIPSLKEMANHAQMQEMSLGLLNYPVLQSADILGFKANIVPVGKDNLAHLELTREIAKRFNHLYGEYFPYPEEALSFAPSLVGTDGQSKMSKSLNNAIFLSDSSELVKKKVKSMYTDPNRISASTPGKVEGNPVFIYHDLFNPNQQEVQDLKHRYQKGQVGDVEVKEKLIVALENFLAPIREKRQHWLSQKGMVEQIIYQGSQTMQEQVAQVLYQVRQTMGLQKTWNKIKRTAQEYQKILKK